MSFDFLTFDSDLFSSSDFVSSEPDLQFFPYDFSTTDDDHHPTQLNPDEIFHVLNQTATTTPHFHTQFSSSPPSNKMGYLSISPQTETNSFQSLPNGFVDFSGFDMNNSNDSTVFHDNAVAQGLQRSYSSNCFSEKSRISAQQHSQLNCVMNLPSFQNGFDNSPEKSFFSDQIRRVCSAGDIQEIKAPQTIQWSLMDENNFKVGKYSVDERKERIHKYRAKRSQRNFQKTIKYACRKTLADNRPRIRGRFARNDEIGDTPTTAVTVKDEDNVFWVDGFNDEDYEGTIRGGGQFLNNYGPTLSQYYGH